MSNLKNHNWKVIFKILTKKGFVIRHQKGSHILLGHSDGRRVTIVRKNPIKVGTLKSILKQAEISQKDFEYELNSL